jgi:hypothetical protein
MADSALADWNVVRIVYGSRDAFVKMVDKEWTCLFHWTQLFDRHTKWLITPELQGQHKALCFKYKKGESTLWWPPLGCHVILLFGDVHVWVYPTSKFWKIFTIFLHSMLGYNLGKRLKNKLFHFILQSGRLEYICGNKCNVLVYSKTQIYF